MALTTSLDKPTKVVIEPAACDINNDSENKGECDTE